MGRNRRPSCKTFSRLIRQGYDLFLKGDLEPARARFDEALAHARKTGSPDEANKALASISAYYIEKGEYERAIKGLREIILRSSDDETICAAAYNLAIGLRRQGKSQKAFVYAKKAFEKSRSLNDLSWMVRCHNLIGNIYLVQSRLDQALRQYRKALDLRMKEKEMNKFSVSILKDNIGYCQLLRGKYSDGIQSVREALEMASELGNKKCICECSHDLSFGYMQLRRLDEAERYGTAALEIAEAEGYKEIVKNCFYLLGEINFLKGDERMRDHYFYKLQELYPHLPFLRDFLCTFDVSKIIALRFPQ